MCEHQHAVWTRDGAVDEYRHFPDMDPAMHSLAVP